MKINGSLALISEAPGQSWPRPGAQFFDKVFKLVIVTCLGWLLYPTISSWLDHLINLDYYWPRLVSALQEYQINLNLFLAILTTLFLNFSVIIWWILLAVTYRPLDPCADDELPTCTVVVPAYNEGRHVLDTLVSVAESDYPADKLQIISVDDGSRDDTWEWMQKAAQTLGPRVELIRLANNRGKRHALYEGFRKSTGAVLVTIDSDSLIELQTLRHLVTPIVKDSKVGAVAGNVRILNTRQGLLPRMLQVNFAYTFDFMRAAQSQVNTVMCTPGALSAYRSDIVMPVLEEWKDQCFLGKPSTIGEDRAMSNLIIREGFHVHFARRAIVHTNIPVKYQGLCRMFLRWERSNIRETLVMSKFIFRRFRQTSALGARINFLLSVYSIIAGETFKTIGLFLLLCAPFIVGPNMLAGAMIAAFLPALVHILRYRNSDFLWAFPYYALYMFALSWISFYALLTPQRASWLTRELKKKKSVATRPNFLPRPVSRYLS